MSANPQQQIVRHVPLHGTLMFVPDGRYRFTSTNFVDGEGLKDGDEGDGMKMPNTNETYFVPDGFDASDGYFLLPSELFQLVKI